MCFTNQKPLYFNSTSQNLLRRNKKEQTPKGNENLLKVEERELKTDSILDLVIGLNTVVGQEVIKVTSLVNTRRAVSAKKHGRQDSDKTCLLHGD